MQTLQCNPATLKSTKTTCLPGDMIQRIRDAWNKSFPKHRIPSTIKKKETLWAAIRDRMSKQYACATEFCALQKLGSKEDIETGAEFFRPVKPELWNTNPTEWHDSQTLSRVMSQYETAFPNFEFIGPVPIDFDKKLPGAASWGRCVVDELCNLDIETVRTKGDDSIGIIFNLDPHDQPGSHWVCAFLNLAKGHSYYYDSYGFPPGPEVRRFLRRCRDKGCREIFWNDRIHQRKTTECGTYCMYVLISLLKGRSFHDICNKPIRDDDMNALRELLYVSEKPNMALLRKAAKHLGLNV
jgi:hypothetical protein